MSKPTKPLSLPYIVSRMILALCEDHKLTEQETLKALSDASLTIMLKERPRVAKVYNEKVNFSR